MIFRVIVQNSLKVDKQCAKAVKSESMILGIIRRSYVIKHKEIILPLYKSIVHLRLEFSVQTSESYLRKKIDLLESFRQASKMKQGLWGKSYYNRLRALKLTTLDRGDLIETFKIIKGYERLDKEYFFEMAHNRDKLWGHELKLYENR